MYILDRKLVHGQLFDLYERFCAGSVHPSGPNLWIRCGGDGLRGDLRRSLDGFAGSRRA
jgi:hypothetical protein